MIKKQLNFTVIVNHIFNISTNIKNNNNNNNKKQQTLK